MDRNMCRTCLKKYRTPATARATAMINIFEHDQVVRQINECTGLTIEPDEKLPQFICRKCLVLLENAMRFRIKCRNSEAYLQSLRREEDSRLVPSASNEAQNERERAEIIAIEDCVTPDQSSLTQALTKDGNLNIELITSECTEQGTTATEETAELSADEETVLTKPSKETKRERRGADSTKSFICDQCGNNFTCRHHFLTHLRRHAGDKQFQCELCEDKFFTHSELNRHMRKHTGERPFACRHCERRFTDYSTRLKHERTHTNERPFGCTHCQKAFTSSYILKNHLLTHTGERSFKCASCNKSFQRRTHLLVHYRSLMHKQNVEKLPAKDELIAPS